MLELGILGFLGYLSSHRASAPSVIGYFVAQRLGSIVFFFGALLPSAGGVEVGLSELAVIGLLFKIGLAPLHW